MYFNRVWNYIIFNVFKRMIQGKLTCRAVIPPSSDFIYIPLWKWPKLITVRNILKRNITQLKQRYNINFFELYFIYSPNILYVFMLICRISFSGRWFILHLQQVIVNINVTISNVRDILCACCNYRFYSTITDSV